MPDIDAQTSFPDEDVEARYYLSLLRDETPARRHLGRERLSAIFEQRGMLDEAAELLENDLRDGARDPSTVRRLATLYRELGRDEDAEEALRYAASLDSNNGPSSADAAPEPADRPDSTATDPPGRVGTLAPRLRRLGAVAIDTLYLAIATIPYYVSRELLRTGGSADAAIAVGVWSVWALALFAVQIILLSARGQSVGKLLLGIRVVRVDTGTNGGFLRNVMLRIVAANALTPLPFVGTAWVVLDSLMIFRKDQRCIHDFVAGTRVVWAK